MELRTLIERLRDQGHGQILEADLGEFALLGLDPEASRRLTRASNRRKRGLTVRRALTARSVKPGDRKALREWLERLVDGSLDAGTRPTELSPGMSRAALREWARGRNLDWALDARLMHVLPPSSALWDWNAWWWRDHTIAEALCAPSDAPGGCRVNKCPVDLQEELVTFLGDRARGAEEALTYEKTWSKDLLRPPQEPALRGAWDLVSASYRSLRDRAAPSVLANNRVTILADPPAVVAQVMGEEVEVPLEAGVPSAIGRDPTRLHLDLAALLAALSLLHTEHSGSARLREVLAKPPWQRHLDALDELLEPAPPVQGDKQLLGWRVFRATERDPIQIEPVLCRRTKAGTLMCRGERAKDLPDSLLDAPADARVAALLEPWKRPPREVVLECLESLAAHPRVVFKGRGGVPPVPVRRGRLTLRLEREGDELHASWRAAGQVVEPAEVVDADRWGDAAGDLVALLRDDQILVVRCPPRQRGLVGLWAERSPRFPAEALPELLGRLGALQGLVDVELGDAVAGRAVEGDPRPLLRVAFDGGLLLEARVQPLVDAPSEVPGEGPDTVHVVRDGEPVRYGRRRQAEGGEVRALVRELGVPDAAEQRPFVWALDDLEQALEVLGRFDPHAHRTEILGELPPLGQVRATGLTMRVSRSRGWFKVGGGAETGVGEVGLDSLLAAVEEGRSWVPVGKKGYARIEAALAERLRAMTAATRDGKVQLGAVHAPLLEALRDEGAAVEGPAGWQRLTGEMRHAAELMAEVPEAFRGELRPYQLLGFRWLARLAEWAPGAVLADDMGLGKTIQAIALFLRRADGPTLVVAPTSVAFNWMEELARFAPSLRARSYTGPARADLLDDLQPGDVLVTTYGVMVRDLEALAAHPFTTLVFDECQALKNPASQRSRAAIQLDAGFRLSLSGTPVENRADELWSVLAATVPGLLGSLGRFRERWGGPIDRGDESRRAALAQLVAPFLLRRTKAEVAPELPARTEMVVRVVLSEEQRVLYERCRRDAVSRLEHADPRAARFQILAELTRLRQLACDPRMVDEGSSVVSTKARHLRRLLRDVRSSGAQALVFSMFVRQLELLRPALEEDGLRVAWLTGSTPAKVRADEVRRFQDGGADVFLVSTKAGGIGLNLTAASYVFHLDPWWNPAAEDQATDRAHRIGQDRPVSVYRLIATHTVEEQILELHEEKRELVDALLQGGRSAAPLRPEELMALLTTGTEPPPPAAAASSTEVPPLVVAAAPAPSPAAVVAPPPAPAATPPPADGPAAPPPGRPPDDWLERATADLAASSLAPSSQRAYLGVLRTFARWAADQEPAPLQALADRYLTLDIPPGRARMFRAAWSTRNRLAGSLR